MWHIRKKKDYTLHQMANDWVTVDEDNGVYSPSAFVYTIDELQSMKRQKHAGQFWIENEAVHDVKYIEHGGVRIRKVRFPQAEGSK